MKRPNGHTLTNQLKLPSMLDSLSFCSEEVNEVYQQHPTKPRLMIFQDDRMRYISTVNPNQLTSHVHLQEKNFIGGATKKQYIGNNLRSQAATLPCPELKEVARLGHQIHSQIPGNTPAEAYWESAFSNNYQPVNVNVEDLVVYRVQFKNSSGHYFYRNNSIEMLDVGEFVKVEADRGEDLGVITGACHMQDFVVEKCNRKIDIKVDLPRFGNIVRVATESERAQLPEKHRLEMYVVAMCKELAQRVTTCPSPYFGGGRSTWPSNTQLESLTARSSQTPWNAPAEDHRESAYSTNHQPVVHVEDAVVYKVQFKSSSGHYLYGNKSMEMLDVGEFVKVEADRGEDLGVVTDACHMQDLVVERSNRKIEVKADRPRIGKIVRVATRSERAQLPEKHRLEMYVVATCKELAQRVHHLPISVLNAVFQFDRHKLTIYYASNARVDFREFVRDLFAMFRSRIWMEKVQLSLPRDSDDRRLFSQALETGSYPFLCSPFIESPPPSACRQLSPRH
eukprot:CAMPEP_0201113610 /NCGR_PEP_ID=MMETSP0812-20130820/77932_1 /ASSEMBLY_ACC=CAM_ASM_000668 /TAXON_ID=98059 /ORGANISM="Dinobryon sp., Strain UTEXLB2267" /LENGTH=507 /DNA_ID=CAMNT_0047377161 /DNA_START=795 /DNA_END=2319 /DNA_ORIENTATION=-